MSPVNLFYHCCDLPFYHHLWNPKLNPRLLEILYFWYIDSLCLCLISMCFNDNGSLLIYIAYLVAIPPALQVVQLLIDFYIPSCRILVRAKVPLGYCCNVDCVQKNQPIFVIHIFTQCNFFGEISLNTFYSIDIFYSSERPNNRSVFQRRANICIKK